LRSVSIFLGEGIPPLDNFDVLMSLPKTNTPPLSKILDPPLVAERVCSIDVCQLNTSIVLRDGKPVLAKSILLRVNCGCWPLPSHTQLTNFGRWRSTLFPLIFRSVTPPGFWGMTALSGYRMDI